MDWEKEAIFFLRLVFSTYYLLCYQHIFLKSMFCKK